MRPAGAAKTWGASRRRGVWKRSRTASVAPGRKRKPKQGFLSRPAIHENRSRETLGDGGSRAPLSDPVKKVSKTYRTNVWSQTHKIFRKLFIAFFFSQKARWPVRPVYRPVRPRDEARVRAAQKAARASCRENSLSTGSRGPESQETVFSRAEDFLKNLVSL